MFDVTLPSEARWLYKSFCAGRASALSGDHSSGDDGTPKRQALQNRAPSKNAAIQW